MKVRLAVIQNKSTAWADAAAGEYQKKISAILKFEELTIKSKNLERSAAAAKKSAEGESLLKNIEASDHLILFEEKGRQFESSVDFSKYLVKVLGSGKRNLTFAIGGPYGFSDSVRERANEKISLSNLTMNHHLARVAALEQIYRALSIWKNLPYHNE